LPRSTLIAVEIIFDWCGCLKLAPRAQLLHMFAAIHHVVAWICVAAVLASVAYCFLCTWAALRFADQRNASPFASADLPPVSILKPLKGADPEMYEALRSHCVQESAPEYEILFGINDARDPAVQVVNRLVAEFPQRNIRMVLCEKRLGANGKVSSLAQLVPAANHDFLLVNDSDIRVSPDYLRTIMTELSRDGVGLVTCLYRGIPGGTLWSKLEALGISTDFMPGVVAAREIERGMRFGLGSTLAFRRGDLDRIGGFTAIADHLADDYELGLRIARLGSRVELSSEVVETHLPGYNFWGFLSHQLRWARTIRGSRPGGYFGLLLTFTFVWALTALLISPRASTGLLFAFATTARFVMAVVSTKILLRDRDASRWLWLLPLRDFVAVAIWVAGFFGRKVVWRGESFTLEGGKLKPS
jgi:ceramide glucosyltransferase